jgi:hypothetical protein
MEELLRLARVSTAKSAGSAACAVTVGVAVGTVLDCAVGEGRLDDPPATVAPLLDVWEDVVGEAAMVVCVREVDPSEDQATESRWKIPKDLLNGSSHRYYLYIF